MRLLVTILTMLRRRRGLSSRARLRSVFACVVYRRVYLRVYSLVNQVVLRLSVVSVKVSDKTKKGMEEFKEKIEWPSEIRNFIEGRLEQAKREETVERIERLLRALPEAKSGTASRLVREDRDGGH